MAAAAMDLSEQGADTLAASDFQALEERVLRAVELLKAEREAHAAASERVAELERQLAGRSEESSRLEGEIRQLQQERDHVRGRVERLLKHLDEFTA